MPRYLALLALVLVLPTAIGAGALADGASGPEVWLKRAEGYAAEIRVPDGRAALLVSIGSGYLEAGLKEAARPHLAEAAAYGRKCQGCYAKAERLADVALLQAQAGDPMAAEKTFRVAREACDELEDAHERISALGYLATQRAEAGDRMLARVLVHEAYAAAEKLEGEDKWTALTALAVPLLELDAENLALPVLHRRRGRDEITDALLLRFRQHLERGDLEIANEYTQHFRHDPLAQLDVYCQILLRYASDGKEVLAEQKLRDATSLAGTLPRKSGRLAALLRVARAASETGAEVAVVALLRDAVATAAEEQDGDALAAGLLRVARTAHATGQLVTCKQTLDEAEKAAASDPILLRVVTTSADLDDFVRAERTAKRIEDPVVSAEARVVLAEAYRLATKCGQALVVAHHAEAMMAEWKPASHPKLFGLLRRLAVVFAACGQTERALDLVKRIAKESPFNAATACTYIAQAV